MSDELDTAALLKLLLQSQQQPIAQVETSSEGSRHNNIMVGCAVLTVVLMISAVIFQSGEQKNELSSNVTVAVAKMREDFTGKLSTYKDVMNQQRAADKQEVGEELREALENLRELKQEQKNSDSKIGRMEDTIRAQEGQYRTLRQNHDDLFRKVSYLMNKAGADIPPR